jgi:hypothetical protein
MLLPQSTVNSTPSNHQGNKCSGGALQWQHLCLPTPLVQASLSAELADRLQLQRLQITRHQSATAAAAPDVLTAPEAVLDVQEVSVARIQALLRHK